ncbi:MAG TPA: AMP-binding protein [Terriglobia bacterium]|nr:AMP-binding protein [Terriglobia bacterium]
MLVEEFLEQSARRFPGKTALVCDGRRLSYRAVDDLSTSLSRALAARGVKRADRVAVYMENSAEAVISVFAALKADAVFMVVNPTTKAGKLAYILNDAEATILLTHSSKLSVVRETLTQVPSLRAVYVAGGVSAQDTPAPVPLLPLEEALQFPVLDAQFPARRCIDVDLAALIYTSGSTGKPKGVMLTHLNIVSAATSITTYLENTSDDIILNVLPLSFDYGLYQVLMAFKMGATVILERSFTYPYKVIDLISKERVTGLPIVPTISAILLQMDLGKFDLSSLRYITNTAAALPTDHILKLRRLFPHVRIFSMYGLTECKRVSYLPPDQLDRRPTSVGKAMPNVEVYIVDEQGRRLGPGEVGELVVRGSNVMKGYWKLPEESERVLKPGPLPGERVLYSGDLFRMDEEGFLYFVGRRDDIIKTRGERVSPKEVEDVLYRLDGVVEAAVVGVPDEVLGKAIKAVISLRKGVQLTVQDVLAHCKANLEDFMVPKYVEIRDSLPKTSSGKISKLELAQL